MRLSAWLSIAAATVTAAITLSTGCTMDFGQFEPGSGSGCGPTEKLCGDACVSRLDPAYGCGDGCTPCNIPGAISVCEPGGCVVGGCTPGRGDCDLDPSNGCEADTDADAQHCGACDSACTSTQICAGGACAGCEPGFSNCDGDPSNGCETDVGSDPAHCGGCTNACPSGPSSAPTCQGGTCGIACTNGALDCDQDPTTGCEIDSLADPFHCGACGRACDAINVTAVACAGGVCTSPCVAGAGNCVMPQAPMPDDGCESDLNTSVDHCGACGRGCDTTNVASLSCSGGACDSTCDLGYANCDQPAAGADDGCELDVSADSSNCGGCGNSCKAQITNGNDLECDGGPMGAPQYCGCGQNNECDTDGNGGADGSCNNTTGLCTCGGSPCAAGEQCVFLDPDTVCSCNAGAGCGAGMTCCQTPSGCFDLSTDPLRCGACGRACPGGFVCQAGSCRCDDAADCDAGSAGAVSCDGTGDCVCGGTTCAPGERCQPDGQCG